VGTSRYKPAAEFPVPPRARPTTRHICWPACPTSRPTARCSWRSTHPSGSALRLHGHRGHGASLLSATLLAGAASSGGWGFPPEDLRVLAHPARGGVPGPAQLPGYRAQAGMNPLAVLGRLVAGCPGCQHRSRVGCQRRRDLAWWTSRSCPAAGRSSRHRRRPVPAASAGPVQGAVGAIARGTRRRAAHARRGHPEVPGRWPPQTA
jgi:hypothetical protein